MSKEAMKMALEALSNITNYEGLADARKVLREALAKQEQGEPVAYTNGKEVILAKHWTADYPPEGWEPLGYTTPQQRTWVGLTDEEIDNVIRDDGDILLDHIYEYGTSAEGITERLRSVARAAINAVENTKGD